MRPIRQSKSNSRAILGIGLSTLLMAGCADTYTCPIPVTDGGCRSVSQVYQDTRDEDGTITPSAGGKDKSGKSDSDHDAPALAANAATPSPLVKPIGPGDVLLTQPRVLRVTVFPWQDANGDLNSGSYVFLRLDAGHWTLH